MGTRPYFIWILLGWVLLANNSYAINAEQLSTNVPACLATKEKLPVLPVDFDVDAPKKIVADFNGDGWCDFALGIRYPINSNMNSYMWDEIMVVGGRRGWKPVLNGNAWSKLPHSLLQNADYPLVKVDLTKIKFVYQVEKGAPYILGVFSGVEEAMLPSRVNPYCDEYQGVHQWDNEVGALKRVDETTRKIVIDFYYSKMAPRCSGPSER